MLEDIVMDANVLMHADDPREARRASCQQLLKELRGCDTKLCVDEGFDLIESKNRSHIGSEYLKHLRFGMLGLEIVAHLAKANRIKKVPRGVPQNVSKHIRTQIGSGADRAYLQVAYNSHDKILASHDFGDIPQTVRDRLAETISVLVLAAGEALSKF